MIILSGPSGIGKSTLAEKLAKGAAKAEIHSADLFFVDGNGDYNFDPRKLSQAHGWCFRGVIQALQSYVDGTSEVDLIIVDNTNTTIAEISPYVAAAQAFNCDVEIRIIEVPKGLREPERQTIRRLGARNIHGVPDNVIMSQIYRMEKLEKEIPPWWKVSKVPAVGF